MDRKTRDLALIGVMTAVMCILAPITIPVGPVPVSLATFVILLSVYILGMKRAMISVCLYLLIGLAGVPVFSGFSAGPAKLLGPTGGYLIGYIPMAAVTGLVTDKFFRKRIISAAGMILATIVLYALGTAWLAYSSKMAFTAALMAGVVPFIPLDLVKIVTAAIVGPVIRTRLESAGLVAYRCDAGRAGLQQK